MNGEKLKLNENDLIGLGINNEEADLKNLENFVFKVQKLAAEKDVVNLISDDESSSDSNDIYHVDVSLYDNDSGTNLKKLEYHSSNEELFKEIRETSVLKEAEKDSSEDFRHDQEFFDQFEQFLKQKENDQNEEQFEVCEDKEIDITHVPSTSTAVPTRRIIKKGKPLLLDPMKAKERVENETLLRHAGNKPVQIIQPHVQKRRRGSGKVQDPSKIKKTFKDNINKNYTKKIDEDKREKLKQVANMQSPVKTNKLPLLNAPVKIKVTQENRSQQLIKDSIQLSSMKPKSN